MPRNPKGKMNRNSMVLETSQKLAEMYRKEWCRGIMKQSRTFCSGTSKATLRFQLEVLSV